LTHFRIDKLDGKSASIARSYARRESSSVDDIVIGINSLSLDMDLKLTISEKVCCCWIVVGNNFIISKLNPYNAILGKGNAFWQTYLEKYLLKIDIYLSILSWI
jgi:hypothetical protein